MPKLKRFPLSGLLWLACLQSPLYGQVYPNLIPNGSFEQLSAYECLLPVFAFPFVQRWYSNSSPDLLSVPCYDPLSSEWQFWNVREGAFDGQQYIGIGSIYHATGLVSAEALATVLDSSLEGGTIYALQLGIRPGGIWHHIADSLRDCVFEPGKRINVYVSADSLQTEAERKQARRILELYDKAFQAAESREWKAYGGCFVADGTERHFAMAASTDSLQAAPPCRTSTRELDYYHMSYYDIDKVEMQRIPRRMDRAYFLCRDDAQWVDLREYWTYYLADSVQMIWDDGFPDTERRLFDAGTYSGRYVLPCGEVPFAIHITRAEICEPEVFAPTAFTPNADGNNESFLPLIRVDVPLAEYHLRIFNRWGRLVFQSSRPGQAWDGWNQGSLQGEGAYAWALDYALQAGERYQLYRKTGTVLLLR